MITFDNTQIAFAHKSDTELKRAYKLFKLIGYRFVIAVGLPLLRFAIAIRLPVLWAVKRTVFAHFCGGEDIDTCAQTIDKLATHKVRAILDYSVEGKEREEDFERCCNEIIKTIDRARGDDNIPFSVFKVTGLAPFGLLENANADFEASVADGSLVEFMERIERIFSHAAEIGQPVFIDAEESWIQDTIDGMALAMMRKYNKEQTIVYNTVQLYRTQRLPYMEELFAIAKAEGFKVGLKLVRGAYMEKERDRAAKMGYPSPIQPDKKSSDKDFDAALTLCVSNIENVALCCGSHNEASSNLLVTLMQQHNISPSDQRIYFAQLLGMSDHISFNLSNAGYNVAKYVPYGPVRDVIPYLIRRAQENTSVKGQQGRELSLISAELKRRKG